MFQDSVPAGSYNDPFLSSVCVLYVNVHNMHVWMSVPELLLHTVVLVCARSRSLSLFRSCIFWVCQTSQFHNFSHTQTRLQDLWSWDFKYLFETVVLLQVPVFMHRSAPGLGAQEWLSRHAENITSCHVISCIRMCKQQAAPYRMVLTSYGPT